MPPNVVVLHSHDTGRYVSPYGYAVPTPNLASLAEESLVFRDAHTPAPTCSPSRAAMTTGVAPHSVGMTGLVNRGWTMDAPERHVANRLREAGYDTVLPGFQHEHGGEGANEEIGYRTFPSVDRDERDPSEQSATDLIRRDREATTAAVEYLRDAEEPFFLSLALLNTHREFPDPGEFDIDPESVRPFEPLPDVSPVREDVAAFHASARVVDECVGRVRETLESEGLLDETLVVYTTDHGPAFPNMKCELADGGTGVALLARFPDGPRGHHVDGLVSHTDFVPTLCSYLEVETPGYAQGESWLSAVEDPGGFDGRDAVFAEVTYHAAYEPKRSVRTDRYRYVRRYGDYDETVLPNIDDGPTKRFLVEHGLGERGQPREALYDLYHDPNERDNRVDDPTYADVLAGLKARLDDWMAATDDPLLAGPVSKPPGGEANPQDGDQPGDPAREPENAR